MFSIETSMWENARENVHRNLKCVFMQRSKKQFLRGGKHTVLTNSINVICKSFA